MKKILFFTISLIVSLTSCKKKSSTTNQVTSNVTNEEINFTCLGTAIGKFGNEETDVEGNKYKTVFIGKQQWFAENLKVTMYNDKTPIKNIVHISDVIKDSIWKKNTDPAWSYLDNVQTNKYLGLLYNFYVIDNGLKKNACPVGWRVPNNDDWNELINFLGGKEVAGDKLKEIGYKHWASGNLGANTSLFTAFPVEGHEDGDWWSNSDGANINYKSYLSLDHLKSLATIGPDADKNDALPIRCIKN